jgi:hypothetical protein
MLIVPDRRRLEDRRRGHRDHRTRRLRAALTRARLAAERTGAETIVLRTAPRTDDAAIEIRRERPFFGALAGECVLHAPLPSWHSYGRSTPPSSGVSGIEIVNGRGYVSGSITVN